MQILGIRNASNKELEVRRWELGAETILAERILTPNSSILSSSPRKALE